MRCLECGVSINESNIHNYKTCIHCANKKITCIECGCETDRFNRNGNFNKSKMRCTNCLVRSKKLKKATTSKECKVCGNKFEVTKSCRSNVVCSDECRRIINTKTSLDNQIKYAHKCEECGMNYNNASIHSKYCSYECRELARKSKINPLSKISKDNYNEFVKFKVDSLIDRCIENSNKISFNYDKSGFTSKLKESVKDRDKWQCQVCGKRTSLEVHHIVKLKYLGENDEDNLITLCSSCHRAIDTLDKEHAIKRCTYNANKNFNLVMEFNNHKETLELTTIRLERFYNTMQSVLDINDDEISEMITTLDDIIEKAITGYK